MIYYWVGFLVLIGALLALDLGVLQRRRHAIGLREALGWSAFWIALSLVFSVGIYFAYENHWLGIGKSVGHETPGETAFLHYITAYVVEKSLSLDNIFVFAIILSYFRVPAQYQHRVLYWGILGAVVLRGVMIAAGAILITKFFWMTYVFGAILLYTAFRLLRHSAESIDPEKNIFIRQARRLFPVTNGFREDHFFVREGGRLAATPLFLVLLMIESSDVLFAVDSIPAVFAVTKDPFLVFTSNIFAILGLRALYFALAGIIDLFRYLKLSLVVLLGYIGVKMIISHHVEVPAGLSLGVIALILSSGIAASVLRSKKAGSREIPGGDE